MKLVYFLKALTWRTIATMTTACLALYVTGSTDVALKVGLADTIIKLAMYVAHERVWKEYT